MSWFDRCRQGGLDELMQKQIKGSQQPTKAEFSYHSRVICVETGQSLERCSSDGALVAALPVSVFPHATLSPSEEKV